MSGESGFHGSGLLRLLEFATQLRNAAPMYVDDRASFALVREDGFLLDDLEAVVDLLQSELRGVVFRGAEEGEVAEVFRVPLAHVLNVKQYVVESRHWRGARRSYYAVPYGPYYIWGATARILRAWTDAIPSG